MLKLENPDFACSSNMWVGIIGVPRVSQNEPNEKSTMTGKKTDLKKKPSVKLYKA